MSPILERHELSLKLLELRPLTLLVRPCLTDTDKGEPNSAISGTTNLTWTWRIGVFEEVHLNLFLPHTEHCPSALEKPKRQFSLRKYSLLIVRIGRWPNLNTTGKGKGNAVTLQAWSGPEDSRKLRFPNYMTTAQDGGKVVSPTHRPLLPPGNAPGTHFC